MEAGENWVSVKSSFIKQVCLCEQSRVFAFRIKKGEDIFVEVSNPRINIRSLLDAFLKSDSKGRFYNRVFKNNPMIT